MFEIPLPGEGEGEEGRRITVVGETSVTVGGRGGEGRGGEGRGGEGREGGREGVSEGICICTCRCM